ncbi:LysR family transcriptional regulator [Tabrizicola sp. BL-A-41-H6]|uniref:LysR family transcriptional regulator n=1 Tax=Tabrizicola sp. BL-A-41-H6 TaxID=3421107 RepID=UPI003D664172
MAVAPPRPKDLPLSALRAFEAAARLESFAAAAVELGVTPGAVTAQVKGLEAALGAALFERAARGVRLTAVGARALPGFVAAFDAMAGAVQVLRAEAAPATVHIATLPALAQLWLSPRLPNLRAIAPEIAVSITAMEAPPNLKRASYDLSLFPGTSGTLVAPEVIFPVCAPGLAARLRQPEDLAGVACLQDASWAEDWAVWAADAMPGQRFVPRGPVFSLYALAVEEAAGGAGVLMGHEALVAGHMARGALVAPFGTRVTLARGLRLWSARPLRPGTAVQRVAAFLLGQGWPA